MGQPLVFVSSPIGVFTPARAGALATIIHALSLEARRDGFDPIVISRLDEEGAPPYEDVRAYAVPFPPVKDRTPSWVRARFDRKFLGWRHFGQRTYAAGIEQVLRQQGLTQAPIVILNDPNLPIYLRPRLPQARLVHWFQNQMTAHPYVQQRFAQSVDVAAGVSTFTARWINEYYGFAPEKVKIIFNGVDTNEFSPAAQELPGPPILNFVGRTDHIKGADLLLEAALLLSEKKLEFGVQLVGANYSNALKFDEFQARLHFLSDQLRERGHEVKLTGHVTRQGVPACFRQAHIHVVPSRWDEPFGLTTLEGMATGMATVASHTGGSPEVVGRGGLTFERDNSQDLAAKIEPWLRDPVLRRDWGEKARIRAQELDWTNSWHMLQRAVGL